MKRKYVIIVLTVGLVILIIFKLIANKKKIDAEKKQPLQTDLVRIPVRTAPVAESLREIKILKTGSISPFREAKVVATGNGTILQLRCKLGDRVTRGQVLALIDSRLLQLDLEKSEVNESKLRNDLQNYTELLEGKATTQEKFNEIKQNYTDAVNQSSRLRQQIADAVIKAPAGGFISEKPIEQGVYVNSGAAIATIVDLSQAKVQIYLTENEVYQVKEGQIVSITTDVIPGKQFRGVVSFISPQADATHNYLTEIMVERTDGGLLRSGTFVYADLSQKTTQTMLVIPREALTESVKDPTVYVEASGYVRLRAIRTGCEMNGFIEVTDGLSKGDNVVTSGQMNLKDSSAVIVSH